MVTDPYRLTKSRRLMPRFSRPLMQTRMVRLRLKRCKCSSMAVPQLRINRLPSLGSSPRLDGAELAIGVGLLMIGIASGAQAADPATGQRYFMRAGLCRLPFA